jgi:hypothetical protein
MSFKVKEKEIKTPSQLTDRDISFRETLPKIIEPYSSFFAIKKKPDIYSGEENMPFKQRHPTYKSLMKLEFQDALRQFERKN